MTQCNKMVIMAVGSGGGEALANSSCGGTQAVALPVLAYHAHAPSLVACGRWNVPPSLRACCEGAYRCESVHKEHLTCCAASDLIPELCGPTTAADGSVSRLKSQRLTSHQPKQMHVKERRQSGRVSKHSQQEGGCLDCLVWLLGNLRHHKPSVISGARVTTDIKLCESASMNQIWILGEICKQVLLWPCFVCCDGRLSWSHLTSSLFHFRNLPTLNKSLH